MTKASSNKVVGYEIKVIHNPNYVGVGAGGVQFAYGTAKVAADSTIVHWYRDHDGYTVTEIVEEAAETVKDTTGKAAKAKE